MLYSELTLPIPLHLFDFVHFSSSAYHLCQEVVPMKLAHTSSSLVYCTHFGTLFVLQLFHSFSKYLLSIYYVPGTEVGLKDSMVKKTHPCL